MLQSGTMKDVLAGADVCAGAFFRFCAGGCIHGFRQKFLPARPWQPVGGLCALPSKRSSLSFSRAYCQIKSKLVQINSKSRKAKGILARCQPPVLFLPTPHFHFAHQQFSRCTSQTLILSPKTFLAHIHHQMAPSIRFKLTHSNFPCAQCPIILCTLPGSPVIIIHI